MGGKLGKNSTGDVFSYSKITDVKPEPNSDKQKPMLVPRDPLQYGNPPPSVQKYLFPERYQRDDEIYLNRYDVILYLCTCLF